MSSAPSSGEVRSEKFARNGGTGIAVLGLLVVLGFLVGWAVDVDDVPLWVPAVALLGGLVLYVSVLRPRVAIEGDELVLRNMFSDVHVPLATVEEVAVQQVLAVRAGEKRFVCAGAGKSLRTVMKGSALQKARTQATSLTGELTPDIERGMDYGDYIETRIRQGIKDERSRLGISSVFSPEAEALRTRIRRDWAKPELAALAVTVAFLLVALLVG